MMAHRGGAEDAEEMGELDFLRDLCGPAVDPNYLEQINPPTIRLARVGRLDGPAQSARYLIMNITKFCLTASLGLTLAIGSFATAEEPKPATPPAPGQGEMQLPPGWTEADMQAYAKAATPGKQHEFLVKGAGEWHGKNSMWMGPDAKEPMVSESTTTVTPIMDGRYVKVEVNGEMPGMGPYKGMGIYGYDNMAEKFVSNWIDNHSTGIMQGEGTLSPDGKTLTWTFTFHCPINDKPTTMREVETITGENTKTLEMFGADPKTGKEYKMMRIELTRK